MFRLLAQTGPPETNFWSLDRTTEPFYSQPLFFYSVITVVVFALLFFGLSRIPSNLRRPIVVGITFLSGMVYVFQWLWPRTKVAEGSTRTMIGDWNFGDLATVVSGMSQILSGMLLAMGVYSIFRVHFGRTFKMQKDWTYSLLLLVSMFTMVAFGFMDNAAIEGQKDADNMIARVQNLKDVLPTGANTPEFRRHALESVVLIETERIDKMQRDYEDRVRKGEMGKDAADRLIQAERTAAPANIQAAQAKIEQEYQANQTSDETLGIATQGARIMRERSTGAQLFNVVFFDMYQPLETGMFSLIAFFILSAAYRAFRVRSIEATILMATALIVLLSFVPLALMLTSSIPANSFAGNFRLDSIGNWLLGTLSAPAIRGIDLGLGLGVLAMAVRIMLGLERGVAVD